MSEMRTDSRPVILKYLLVVVPMEKFQTQPSLFKISLQFRTNLVRQIPFWYRTNNLYVSLTNVSSVNSVCSDEVM